MSPPLVSAVPRTTVVRHRLDHLYRTTIAASADSNSEARLAERDLVAGFQPHPSGSCENWHHLPLSDDMRPMHAAIVVDAEFLGTRFVGEVRVLTRHTLVDVARSLDERDIVGSNQSAVRILDFGAPAQIDPFGHK